MLTSSRLYAKEFSCDKSSSIKQTIYQKLHNLNGNTFSFSLHVCLLFISPLDCCFRRLEFNNTLLCPFYQISVTPPPLCRNHTKPKTDKQIQACERLTVTELCMFLYICSEQSVGQNTLFGGVAFKYIVEISQGVTSSYVQAQGGILLKFNILSLYYVRYCA